MRKILSIILIVLISASLTVPVFAGCTVAGSASASTVYVGDTVKVTFTFTADVNIGGAQPSINFSSETLTCTALTTSLGSTLSNANAGSNTIKIADFSATATSKKYTITITFKTKAVGDATVTYTGGEFFDTDAYSISAPASKTVKISVKEKNKSSNCNLASLSGPEGYEFSPKFSPSVTEYSVTVPNSVDSYSLKWTKEDADATAKSLDSVELKVGDNQRRIKVTAPDGTTKTYTVKIKRLEATAVDTTPVPTATPVPESTSVLVGGNVYKLISKITLELPEGATLETVNYEGKEVQAAKFGNIYLVQLYTGETDDFFVYSVENQKFYTYDAFANEQTSINVLGYAPNELTANGGMNLFAQTIITVGEAEYLAWTNPALDEGYYVINVQNELGENYAAVYCASDGSVQKLSKTLLTALLGANAAPTPDSQVSQGEIDWQRTIVIGGITLIIIIVVVVIVLAVVDKKVTRKTVTPKRNWNLDNEVDPYDNLIEEDEFQQEPVYRGDDNDFE